MNLSFWYKGNNANLSLEFYDDYGVTTDDFPLPAGAVLYADSANPVYEIDTSDILIDTVDRYIDTFAVADQGAHANVYLLQIDTMTLSEEEILAEQNFDNEDNLKLTPGAWVWSGSSFYDYDDWKAATVDDEAWSKPEALWLPGDPGWGGAEGYVGGIVDDTNYVWEFMYKGQVQFILNLGSGTKYDLVGDPDGIVPEDATADASGITWMLDSKYWTRFRFEYEQGSWLADSSVTSPATISFDLLGTYNADDLGFVDDFMVAVASKAVPEMIDTNYVVIDSAFTTQIIYVLDTLSTTYNQMGAMWDLPAVTGWTKWSLNWTNPSDDIGGTLTMILDSKLPDVPDYLDDEKTELDFDHAGWTYFDDFQYGITTGIAKKSVMVQDLHVYPNPAVDMLYLSLEIPLRTVEIFNSSGQKVMMLRNPDRKFSVSELSSGLYIIHAYDMDGSVHQVKFVKK